MNRLENPMLRASLLVLVLVAAVSCGYSFQGSGSILPDDVETVAVPLVENRTTASGLGMLQTEKLRSRFERYGTVRVVSVEDDPDATLNTVIRDINTTVRGVTSETDIVLEQIVTLTVDAELTRRNGQVLWKGTISASESIPATGDVVVTSSSNFAQGGIDASALNSLNDAEVARGASAFAFDDLTDDVARKIYLDAVAADF